MCRAGAGDQGWCDIRGLCAECHSFHNSSQDWVHCLASTTPAPMLSPLYSVQHSALINITFDIALHYHYIGTYYYINITSIKSRSLSIIFTFSKHQIGKSGYLLSVTWERNIQLLLKMYLQIIEHYNLCKNLQFIQSQNCN